MTRFWTVALGRLAGSPQRKTILSGRKTAGLPGTHPPPLPLSLHGVGLSIGSTDPLDRRHLVALKTLIRRFEPALVSEHLSWGSVGGRHFNDLLPLPYTEEALDHLAGRVSETQDILGRQILIENPSSYLQYVESVIPEWDFLAERARRSGCGYCWMSITFMSAPVITALTPALIYRPFRTRWFKRFI